MAVRPQVCAPGTADDRTEAIAAQCSNETGAGAGLAGAEELKSNRKSDSLEEALNSEVEATDENPSPQIPSLLHAYPQYPHVSAQPYLGVQGVSQDAWQLQTQRSKQYGAVA